MGWASLQAADAAHHRFEVGDEKDLLACVGGCRLTHHALDLGVIKPADACALKDVRLRDGVDGTLRSAYAANPACLVELAAKRVCANVAPQDERDEIG